MPRMANRSKEKHLSGSITGLYDYLPDGISFISSKAFSLRTIYFPLCGIDAEGIKSSITPRLSGDIKIDKDRFLTKPVSVEDLRQNVRNFFCHVQGKAVVSLVSGNGHDAVVEAGMLWHKLKRVHREPGVEMEALNFVPISDENIELMRVTVRNISPQECVITPTFSLPVFARALANKHDHEHVTSLLQRIEQLPGGICVEPTMTFDERGHRAGEGVYYVWGVDGSGHGPLGTFPTVESFYGESGDASSPEAVMKNAVPEPLPDVKTNGKEAVGALRFRDAKLAPGASCEYLIIMGMDSGREAMREVFSHFNTVEKADAALARNKAYWEQRSGAIEFSTGNHASDRWMRWVSLQPVLRRIFGCSFLPDHDYGKGGRGWRDIWQDLLSLILIEPQNIRRVLIDNFAGVRIDGSNATIIGSLPGEFIADRNAIARVWMDHGVWPLTTLLLYIHQTGDYDILLEENTYFRDAQLSRNFAKDGQWTAGKGNFLADKNGQAYRGSIMEHLLVQHLTQFFNVGEHNIIRLEDADWNDGLDMARERGESVAFTSYYGGNLLALADLLEDLSAIQTRAAVHLAPEVKTLLDSLTGTPVDYDDPEAKKKFLFETYFPSVQPVIGGERIEVSIKAMAEDLRRKGNWIFEHVRAQEIVSVGDAKQENSWFNGYYDNQGTRLEGKKEDHVRMTLVGQVFPIMSGLACPEEIKRIMASVRTYLRDERSGGVRLNTDFHLSHYLDLGRAFGFAYGTKENGAFFNHMSVMYACALYKRGFVREGYEVLRAIFEMCMDTDRSKIYPGIPEYFDGEGRGRYHYLTGSASWLILVKLTEVFGVRGEKGDLLLAPKLVREEFDPQTGLAAVNSYFAGKKVSVTYENTEKLDYGDYWIKEAYLNGEPLKMAGGPTASVKIQRKTIENSPLECVIRVVLKGQK